MNGPENYQEAEGHREHARIHIEEGNVDEAALCYMDAQVSATLALAAAQALGYMGWDQAQDHLRGWETALGVQHRPAPPVRS